MITTLKYAAPMVYEAQYAFTSHVAFASPRNHTHSKWWGPKPHPYGDVRSIKRLNGRFVASTSGIFVARMMTSWLGTLVALASGHVHSRCMASGRFAPLCFSAIHSLCPPNITQQFWRIRRTNTTWCAHAATSILHMLQLRQNQSKYKHLSERMIRKKIKFHDMLR